MIELVARGALLLPASRTMVRTSLGTVAQTRAALSQYRCPDWPIHDALRRSPEAALVPAIAHYEAALAWDAHNVAANRRLGQTELAAELSRIVDLAQGQLTGRLWWYEHIGESVYAKTHRRGFEPGGVGALRVSQSRMLMVGSIITTAKTTVRRKAMKSSWKASLIVLLCLAILAPHAGTARAAPPPQACARLAQAH